MHRRAIPWTAARRRALARLQRQPLLRQLLDFAARHGVQLYVVGGTVRDVCLGRQVQDLDLAMAGDAMALARAFADAVAAAFVPLDAARGEARIVYRRRYSIDLARLRGETIVEDLRQRDFTINALACPLAPFLTEPMPVLLDPYGGWPDLQAGLIRMVAPHSLADDPLRVLRAFRLAATLAFRIAADTLKAMPPTAPRLAEVAGERLQSEWMKLLAAPGAAPLLEAMARLQVLESLFPELRAGPFGARAAMDPLAHALAAAAAVEALVHTPASVAADLAAAIRDYVQPADRQPLLKWAALLHAMAPAAPRPQEATGASPCPGDTARAAALWPRIAARLRLSRARTEYVGRLLAHQGRPFELAAQEARGEGMLRPLYRWCKELGDDVLGAFILALGEARACRDAHLPGPDPMALAQCAARSWQLYLSRIRPVLRGPRLVTGDDLQAAFGLTPGPPFKTLLEAVEMAQAEGCIQTREEALRWLERRLQQP
jgi:poly(A) polymerase